MFNLNFHFIQYIYSTHSFVMTTLKLAAVAVKLTHTYKKSFQQEKLAEHGWQPRASQKKPGGNQ